MHQPSLLFKPKPDDWSTQEPHLNLACLLRKRVGRGAVTMLAFVCVKQSVFQASLLSPDVGEDAKGKTNEMEFVRVRSLDSVGVSYFRRLASTVIKYCHECHL